MYQSMPSFVADRAVDDAARVAAHLELQHFLVEQEVGLGGRVDHDAPVSSARAGG
jgi:hypothetical protein